MKKNQVQKLTTKDKSNSCLILYQQTKNSKIKTKKAKIK